MFRAEEVPGRFGTKSYTNLSVGKIVRLEVSTNLLEGLRRTKVVA